MEITKRHWSGRWRLFVATIFAITFVVPFFSGISAFAASNLFQIQNVTLSEISGYSEGSITDSDETAIVSDITFKRLGDSAKFIITLKNTDNKDHIIESITNDNTNTYVSYEHDSYANTAIKAGESFDFVVVAKYINVIADLNDSVQTANVKFIIKCLDGEPEAIAINPKTSDNIFSNVVTLIISIASLFVIRSTAHKRIRKANKLAIVGITALIAVTTTATVNAITTIFDDFTLATNYTLKIGRLIHYNGNYPDGGSMEDEHLTNSGTLKPNAYTAIGYHFAGWSLELDGEKVYDDKEPMGNIPDGDEPLTLYVIWEPNTYTFIFHANSEHATGSMDPFEADYEGFHTHLPLNGFELDGYRFIGWKVDNQGVLIEDGANISNYDAEDGDVINLYAQWELMPVGIDYYKNSPEAVGTTIRQENFGRTTTLRTPNYRHDGYGFAGWNTKPDGTGTMYGPNELVTMPSTGLKLYAIWIKAEENATMQSFDDTADPYASYPNGKVIALRDNRDNQVYTVTKLLDGKWWMTENLRLNPVGIQLTAENTNNPTQAAQNITRSANMCTEKTAACINQFVFSISSVHPSSSTTGYFAYGNGGYYNTYTATAGHAAVDIDNPITEQVAGDICPKGWHLPISGEHGDFRTLDISLGGNGYNTLSNYEHAQKYFKAPINFVMAGWSEKAFSYRNIGNEAAYLENGTNGLEHSVSFFVDAAAQIVNGTTEKYYAHTVRCIAN